MIKQLLDGQVAKQKQCQQGTKADRLRSLAPLSLLGICEWLRHCFADTAPHRPGLSLSEGRNTGDSFVNEEIDSKDAVALLLLNQQHIHENIKFADQKAAAFIGINGALLSVIYGMIRLDTSNPATVVFGSLACLSLAIGIGFAVWTIKPRGEQNKERGPGVIDSARISQLSLEQYLSRMKEISDADLLKELRTFIYDRSVIDREKYKKLNVSLPFSAAGWLLSLIAAVLVKMNA